MRRALLPALAAFALLPSMAQAIVGGGPAPAGRYDFTANVAIGGVAGCTGSLVTPTWVVTAGHCASYTGIAGIPTGAAMPASSFRVTLGTVNADGSGGETHDVKSVHVDPNYAATNGTGSDVSLLELAEPATVKPVHIAAPAESGLWEPGDALTIAGFGVTQEDGDAPPVLQAAEVPRVADSDCAKAYDDPTPVLGNAFDPKTAICAGLPQGGKDTCQGDSGGPILAPLGSGFRLIGATSYGEGCAREGKPGVYARLAEGSVKAFVSGFAPDAYATPSASTPATPSTPAAACPRYRLRIGRRGRATLYVGGRRVRSHRAPVTFRVKRTGAPAKLRVVVRRKGHRTRIVRRTVPAC